MSAATKYKQNRVVITGMSGITSLGDDWASIKARMETGRNGIAFIPEWEEYQGLNTHLGGPATHFKVPDYYTRKQMRSMGRVSQMAVVATEQALKNANLIGYPGLSNGDCGVAYGSSTGSTAAVAQFVKMLTEKNTQGITANTYIKMMPHTAAVNVGLFFGICGRIITTNTACTSGSQAIGYSYEVIKNGNQKLMIAGGSEELCPTEAAVFDTLFATSIKNDTPELTPRPFDANRDGLVIGEGSCTLILEELEHAKQRGARIYAEVVGFATNCDATHVTQPNTKTIQIAIESAINDAGISPHDIGYVSAHGTATDRGDIAESHAAFNVFGDSAPISSLKSYFGHTLGACGAIESWLAIEMMNDKWFAPTINLDNIDSNCAPLDYIVGNGREIDCDLVMNNNFAFGGINTSLVFKRHG